MPNPKLRFKFAVNENICWRQVQLNELGVFIKGQTYNSSNVTENESDVLIIRSSNLQDLEYVDLCNDLQFVSIDIESEQSLKKNDVVICTANGSTNLIGKASIYDGSYHGSISWGAFCTVFRSNNVLAKFFFRTPQYKSLIHVYKQGGNGSLGNLNISAISSEKIFFPESTNEQQKIAEFFTALDEKIRIQLNKVEKLNAIKTGILANVFSEENTSDWTVRMFDDIFALNRTFPVPWERISNKLDKSENHSQIIHYGDILTIYGNIVNPNSDSIGYLVTDVNAKDDDYLCDGDIVFADAAEDYTVGKAIELDGVNCKVLSGLHTIAARPKITFVKGYLSYFFNSPLFKRQVRRLATGTKVMSLTHSSLKTTSISFPSIEEQQKISNLLITLDDKIALNKMKVAALKQLKKAFLQRMFV